MRSVNDRILGPALVALWVVVVVWMQWGAWTVDMSALYYAGYFFGEAGPEAIYNRVSDTGTAHGYFCDHLLRNSVQQPRLYPPK